MDLIWNEMGANITCSVQDEDHVSISTPPGFVSDLPMKIFTHGSQTVSCVMRKL